MGAQQLYDDSMVNLDDATHTIFVQECVRHQLALINLPTENFRLSGRYISDPERSPR